VDIFLARTSCPSVESFRGWASVPSAEDLRRLGERGDKETGDAERGTSWSKLDARGVVATSCSSGHCGVKELELVVLCSADRELSLRRFFFERVRGLFESTCTTEESEVSSDIYCGSGGVFFRTGFLVCKGGSNGVILESHNAIDAR
jgi:hypothetical protein